MTREDFETDEEYQDYIESLEEPEPSTDEFEVY